MSNILYIIPARGGSKGIPGKNIKLLAGRPLIAYSIDVARQVACNPSDICISTDAPEIASVAKAEGIDVPFLRPAELATDTCGTYEVLLHALDFYKTNGKAYDTIVLLQPTSPLRTADDVRGAMELYTPDIDMVVSVKEAATNPYYNAYEVDDNGFLHISKGDGHYTRRQDAPPVWEYNGAIYVINVASLRRQRLSEFSRRRCYVMDRARSIDLDTPLDWLIAETLIKKQNEKESCGIVI